MILYNERFEKMKYLLSYSKKIDNEEAERLLLDTETGRAIYNQEERILYEQDVSNIISILEELNQKEYNLKSINDGIEQYEKDHIQRIKQRAKMVNTKFDKAPEYIDYQHKLVDKYNNYLLDEQRRMNEIWRIEYANSVKR